MSNLKIIKQIKLIRNLNEDNFRNLNPGEKYFYKKEQISKNWAIDRTFNSSMVSSESKKLYKGWQKAVDRTMKWEDA